MSKTYETTRYSMLAHWWVKHPKTSLEHIGLMAVLASYTTADNPTCFPSHSTIASCVDKGRTTVLKYLNQLVDMGLIEKVRQARTDGGQTSNLYRLVYEMPEAVRLQYFSHVAPVTPPVQEANTNNNQNKNILSKKEVVVDNIEEWEPSQSTIDAILKADPECDVTKYVQRFKDKVRRKAYQYSDFDEALLAWFSEDLEKNLVPRTRPHKAKKFASKMMQAMRSSSSDKAVIQLKKPEKTVSSFMDHLEACLGVNAVKAWLSAVDLDAGRSDCLAIKTRTAYGVTYVRSNYDSAIRSILTLCGFSERYVLEHS